MGGIGEFFRNLIWGSRALPTAENLRAGVREAYSRAASKPDARHPFPVGRWFAESLGYPADMLDQLPSLCSASFAGVSNIAIWAELPEGSRVLDVGCGAGLDALIAARRVGPNGSVVGVDFSAEMLGAAQASAKLANAPNASFIQTDAEGLPFEDGSFDIILANGIFNLNPLRERIVAEMRRVLKPGGRLYASELVLTEQGPSKTVCKLDDWFS